MPVTTWETKGELFIMTKSMSLIAVIALLLALLPAQASAQSIDENFYYKLSTQFRVRNIPSR